MKFKEMSSDFDFPKAEQEISKYWEEHHIFKESLDRRQGCPEFVFYEGPPTANGLPHIGHAMARTVKDTICRYKTMKGFRVERKAGWDTQGLPVELEVEKQLGFSIKEKIGEFGIEKFNLLLTGDSASLHIASDLGVRVAAIFGPTDPEEYGPRGKEDAVMRKDLKCSPCKKAQCKFGTHECMTAISAEEVLSTIRKVLK